VIEPIQFPRLARGVRWGDVSAELLGRIDAVIEDLDPADSDTATVTEDLHSATDIQLREMSQDQLRDLYPTVPVVPYPAARTAVPPHAGLHPDGWGPCPDGCPCSSCDPWEHPDPAFAGTEIVDVAPPARGWLARAIRSALKGTPNA
jgi:hypothetical protein